MVIMEHETPESMQRRQQYKDEFNAYVKEHLDERMRLNPKLTMEDVVAILNGEFAEGWIAEEGL